MLALAVAWAGLCRLPQYRDTTTEFKWNGAFRTPPMIVSFHFSFFVYVSRTLKIIEMIVNTSSFFKLSFLCFFFFFPYNEEDLHKHVHDWLFAVCDSDDLLLNIAQDDDVLYSQDGAVSCQISSIQSLFSSSHYYDSTFKVLCLVFHYPFILESKERSPSSRCYLRNLCASFMVLW